MPYTQDPAVAKARASLGQQPATENDDMLAGAARSARRGLNEEIFGTAPKAREADGGLDLRRVSDVSVGGDNGIGSMISDARTQIALEYPTIAKQQKNWNIGYSPEQKYPTAYLEFYPEHEEYSPTPGTVYQEIYPRLAKEADVPTLKNMLAGDALHWFGGVNGAGAPNDEMFYALKKRFQGTRTPDQTASDQRTFKKMADQGDTRPWDTWQDEHRTDAYLRGYLFPDKDDNWRKSGTYTPEQMAILGQMKAYLSGKGYHQPESTPKAQMADDSNYAAHVRRIDELEAKIRQMDREASNWDPERRYHR